MTASALEMKMQQLAEWSEALKEAQDEVDSLKAEIKAEFAAREVEQMVIGKYVCRCKAETRLILDQTAFKYEQYEMYTKYAKPKTTVVIRWRTDEPKK